MSSLLDKIKEVTNLSGHVDINSAQNQITSNIEFKGANVWILIFAIIMASVGLNVNSIPVVIGAMLISPLMGPIMGIGMALGINDTALLRRSFKNLLVMTIISIVASTAFFLLSPLNMEQPTELLARTNPTIYDVFIALFGGLAVIVEVCKKEKGTVIAGAAIATALMPPLCTAGYGIANGKFFYFIGAIYLYFINSAFIALATFLMVRYLKFPLVQFADKTKQVKVNRIITLFTIILIIPSIYSAVTVIKQNKFSQQAKEFIKHNKAFRNGYIYSYDITHSATRRSTITIDIAGEKLSEQELAHLKRSIAKYNINPEQLIIHQTSTYVPEENGNSEFMKNIYEQNSMEIKKREDYIKQLETRLKEYKAMSIPSKQIEKEIKAQYPDIKSLTLALGDHINGEEKIRTVVAVIKFERKISTKEEFKLQRWLAARLDIPEVEIIQK